MSYGKSLKSFAGRLVLLVLLSVPFGCATATDAVADTPSGVTCRDALAEINRAHGEMGHVYSMTSPVPHGEIFFWTGNEDDAYAALFMDWGYGTTNSKFHYIGSCIAPTGIRNMYLGTLKPDRV